MTDDIKVSLHTLPANLIYCILDHLDEFNIFCTMQNICTRINSIISGYRRYKVKVSFILACYFVLYSEHYLFGQKM